MAQEVGFFKLSGAMRRMEGGKTMRMVVAIIGFFDIYHFNGGGVTNRRGGSEHRKGWGGSGGHHYREGV